MIFPRWTPLVLLTSLTLVGCDSGKAPAEGKPAVAAKDGEAPQTKADPAADAATPADTKPAGTQEAAADDHGCIHAEGQQGDDPSCPHGAGDEPMGPATGEGHYGEPFSQPDATPTALGQVLAASELPTEPVLVSGEVEAVCQMKGCWMVVKDGAASARVLMKDHGFAVPMDCRGKKATIEGTVTARTFDEAQVKHLEKDGGGNPDEVSGERTEHVLTASGVLIQS